MTNPRASDPFPEVDRQEHLPEAYQYANIEYRNPPVVGPAYSTPQADTESKPFPSSLDQKPIRHDRVSGPYGLSAIAFACLASLLTALVIGAALGGALGSSLAHEQSKVKSLQAVTASLAQNPTLYSCSSLAPTTAVSSPSPASASATSDPTNYAPLAPTSIGTLAIDCPALDNQQYQTIHNQEYTIHCGTGLNSYDLASIIAYDFPDCVEACSSMNYFANNQTLCTAVAWSNQFGTDEAHANCYLKYEFNINALNTQGLCAAQIANNGAGLR